MFVDLTADVTHARRLLAGVAVLDGDRHTDRGETANGSGVEALSTICEAVGVLIAGGNTPEAARAELDRRAGSSGVDVLTAAGEVPACLRCMRDGGRITATDLAPIVLASQRRARLGVPTSASLAAIRGAIGRFGAIVVARAGISRAPAVAAVLSQAAIFGNDFAQAVIAGRRPIQAPRPSWMEDLSTTQEQILQLAARGRSTRQIAQQLHYSEQNVGYHLHHLMQKMHVRNRTVPVARAVQHGLITVTDD